MKILNENSKRSPQVKKDLPAVFDKSQVLDLVTWAATIEGKNLNEPQMYMLVTELSTLVNTRHRNLSMDEIRDAVRRGVAGDYGDYFGLSLKSINHWITSYKAAKVRKEERELRDNSISIKERAEFIRKGLAERGYKPEI
jgi:hypothetical protein